MADANKVDLAANYDSSNSPAKEVTDEQLMRKILHELCVTLNVVTKDLSYDARRLSVERPKEAAVLLRALAISTVAAGRVLKQLSDWQEKSVSNLDASKNGAPYEDPEDNPLNKALKAYEKITGYVAFEPRRPAPVQESSDGGIISPAPLNMTSADRRPSKGTCDD